MTGEAEGAAESVRTAAHRDLTERRVRWRRRHERAYLPSGGYGGNGGKPYSWRLRGHDMKTEDIHRWRGHDVIDVDGKKIGKLEAVYVDTRTDEPFFATVRMGVPTRYRLAFVPLAGAMVGPGHVRVAQPKSRVKRAPSIDTDGELPAGDEAAIFAYYDLSYQAAPDERWLARR